MEKAAKAGEPVAAIIIEPIQAEGGMWTETTFVNWLCEC